MFCLVDSMHCLQFCKFGVLKFQKAKLFENVKFTIIFQPDCSVIINGQKKERHFSFQTIFGTA